MWNLLLGVKGLRDNPSVKPAACQLPFQGSHCHCGYLASPKRGGEPPSAVEGLFRETIAIAPAAVEEFSHEQKRKRFVMEKDYHYTGYHSNLKPIARTLRKNMTRQERHLWYDFLRNYPIHFYRQRVIEHYIVDFYCSSANLVIEVDGSQHYTVEGEEYDRIRTDILKLHQLQVLRFSNWEIDNQFPSVCAKINAAVKG